MSIFLISDTHFNHANIIRYCRRPFKSVQEMNAALVNNWNRVVKERDIVFLLGDVGKPLGKWLGQLNGSITLIRGSHDSCGLPSFVLHHNNTVFLLIHNPDLVPEGWPGWVIHGHKHNNHPLDYPFINRERKRVNVSVEMINYTPIMLDSVERIIKAQEVAHGETADSARR